MAADPTSLDERRAHRVVNVLNLHAHIQQHNVIIQRTQVGIGQDGFNRQVKAVGGFLNHGMHLGLAYDKRAIEIGGVSDDRAREKKDLQDLNERLANYIERVRFYEAQNRKLASELARLTVQVKEPSHIKDKYEVELAQARRLLEEADKEKAQLRIDVEELRYENDELRLRLDEALRDAANATEKFERQNQQLSDLEGEVGLLRRRLASLEAERDKEKARIKELQEAIRVARKDLNSETLLHIDAANKRQTLVEELLFLKSLHEQEVKELRVLICRDSTTENQDYWKTQMGLALREIQEAYDRNVEEMKTETETYFKFQLEMIETNSTKNHMQWAHFKEENVRLREQLQTMEEKLADAESKYARLKGKFDLLIREREERARELERENSDLRNQVITLQATIEAMIKEIKIILDSKHGLELEIITYRRLLETEESRVGFRTLVNYSNDSSETDSGISGFGTGEFIMRKSGTLHIGQDIHNELVGRLIALGRKALLPPDKSMTKQGVMNIEVAYVNTSKGSIGIAECPVEGKSLVLENTGEEEERLQNWSLTRNIDGNDYAIYKFNESVVLKPGQNIKVWSKGSRPFAWRADDLESGVEWLGVGDVIVTRLVNPAGEERAAYTLEFRWG